MDNLWGQEKRHFESADIMRVARMEKYLRKSPLLRMLIESICALDRFFLAMGTHFARIEGQGEGAR